MTKRPRCRPDTWSDRCRQTEWQTPGSPGRTPGERGDAVNEREKEAKAQIIKPCSSAVVIIFPPCHLPVSACVWAASGHRRKRRRCPVQERGRTRTSGLSTWPPLWEYATDLRREQKKISDLKNKRQNEALWPVFDDKLHQSLHMWMHFSSLNVVYHVGIQLGTKWPYSCLGYNKNNIMGNIKAVDTFRVVMKNKCTGDVKGAISYLAQWVLWQSKIR